VAADRFWYRDACYELGKSGKEYGMHRRDFLFQSGALAVLMAQARRAGATDVPLSFQLSAEGCGRATGYAEANKIVTWRDKTHVAYLDSPPEGFRVRIRTLDHHTGEWSPAYTIDEAYDNHGGPALAVDSEGFLHVAYYPHHHPMRIKKSQRPNDASLWSAAEEVGEKLTYPTLVVDDLNTLYLTCRQSDSGAPWRANLYTKKAGGTWEGPTTLLQAEHKGYAHFMDALAWSADKRYLHLVTRIHDGDPPRGHTIGYLRSADKGVTWTRHDGTPVALPATAATVDVIKQFREGPGAGLRAAGLAVAPDGRPVVLCSNQDVHPNEAWLATPGEDGWEERSLRPALPPEYSDWGVFAPGGVTFSDTGAMYVVLTMIAPGLAEGQSGWGHPLCEVVAFESTDGGKTFRTVFVSEIDAETPHWLPNIERATGHNSVKGLPGIIFTEGGRGEDNKELVANKVWWVRL